MNNKTKKKKPKKKPYKIIRYIGIGTLVYISIFVSLQALDFLGEILVDISEGNFEIGLLLGGLVAYVFLCWSLILGINKLK